jgi:hypothetical protein
VSVLLIFNTTLSPITYQQTARGGLTMRDECLDGLWRPAEQRSKPADSRHRPPASASVCDFPEGRPRVFPGSRSS